jgi:phenylalanyl-tRNA synthetase beta chain
MNFFSRLFGGHSTAAASSNFVPDSNIVAAKVSDVQKHPNADRLRIIKLDIGNHVVEPVVCGAFNFGVGDTVALALPGARIAQNVHSEIHESFVLGKAKIRGIESQGMICAAFELGLTKDPGDKPEIILLKNGIKPGSQFLPEMLK